MTKLILNLQALVSVKITDKVQETDLMWMDAVPKKWIWQKHKPAG